MHGQRPRCHREDGADGACIDAKPEPSFTPRRRPGGREESTFNMNVRLCACAGAMGTGTCRAAARKERRYCKPYTRPKRYRATANLRPTDTREYPVSDSPRRVNTRLAIFQASHTLGMQLSHQSTSACARAPPSHETGIYRVPPS
jgi:hypothetical protein